MKKVNWHVLISVISLAALTLACNYISNLGRGGDKAIVRDDFSDSSSGWGTGTDSNSSVEYANGGLQIIIHSARYITWSNPNKESYHNVHFEISEKNHSYIARGTLGMANPVSGYLTLSLLSVR